MRSMALWLLSHCARLRSAVSRWRRSRYWVMVIAGPFLCGGLGCARPVAGEDGVGRVRHWHRQSGRHPVVAQLGVA